MADSRMTFAPVEMIDYDPETGWSDSTENYAELSNVQVVVESGDYYRSTSVIGVTMYLHERTGLIVGDVAAFEDWLNGRSK